MNHMDAYIGSVISWSCFTDTRFQGQALCRWEAPQGLDACSFLTPPLGSPHATELGSVQCIGWSQGEQWIQLLYFRTTDKAENHLVLQMLLCTPLPVSRIIQDTSCAYLCPQAVPQAAPSFHVTALKQEKKKKMQGKRKSQGWIRGNIS